MPCFKNGLAEPPFSPHQHWQLQWQRCQWNGNEEYSQRLSKNAAYLCLIKPLWLQLWNSTYLYIQMGVICSAIERQIRQILWTWSRQDGDKHSIISERHTTMMCKVKCKMEDKRTPRDASSTNCVLRTTSKSAILTFSGWSAMLYLCIFSVMELVASCACTQNGKCKHS